MRKSAVIIAALGGALLLAFLIVNASRRTTAHADGDDEKGGEPVAARVTTVERGSLTATLRVLGTLQALPNQRAKVAAQIGGRLVDLKKRRGDRVRAGEVVATIYNADLAADAQRARAAQQEAQTQTRVAETGVTLERETNAALLGQAEASLRAAQARSEKLKAGNRREDIAEAQAALQGAQADLDRLQHGNRPEEIERAQATLHVTEAELRKLKTGPRQQEIAQGQAAVRDADAQLVAAKKNVERTKSLFTDGLASGKEVERAEADLAAAQAKADSAREQLKLLREGTRIEEIQAQEAKVREAEAALRLARAGSRPEEITAQKAKVEQARQMLLRLQAGARPEEIKEADAAVNEAKAKLDQAKAGRLQLQSATLNASAAHSKAQQAAASATVAEVTLGKAQIIAPVSGVVGDVVVNRGEVVSAGAPVLDVVNADALRVVAQVPAAHQAALRVGGKAVVTIPHLLEEKINTSISIVAPLANSESGMVTIEALVPNSKHELKEGMAVEVTLTLKRENDALLVPASAVFARAGENYVYVVDEKGEAKERQIEVGTEDEGKSQVLKGLKPGERIVADGTLSLADGANIKGEGAKTDGKDQRAVPSKAAGKAGKGD